MSIFPIGFSRLDNCLPLIMKPYPTPQIPTKPDPTPPSTNEPNHIGMNYYIPLARITSKKEVFRNKKLNSLVVIHAT